MKCTGHIKEVNRDYKSGRFVLSLEINEDIQSTIDDIKDVETLDLSLEKHKEKRSLDANAYFWVLIGKIAQKVKGKSKEDIYRNYIKETGAYEVFPVREDALVRWNEIWQERGTGWVTEDIGTCKLPNLKKYHNVKCYYGTSVYDSVQMNHLIDLVVQDCKDLGIETLPPNEIERMKHLWKA